MARYESTDAGSESGGRVVRTIDPQVQTTEDDPSQLCAARAWMGAKWELPNALRGGTAAMRAAGEKYLPRETAEKPAAYRVRLNRSFLLNAYGDTIDSTAGRPFTHDVTLSEDSHEELKPLAEDIDLQGRTLTQFASDLLCTGWHYGLAHFLVEFPYDPLAGERTLADEEGLRAFFVEICPEDVLGWRSKRINGVETLTQLRIRETSTEPDGKFGERVVTRIRVFERIEEQAQPTAPGEPLPEPRVFVRWILYSRKSEKAKWEPEKEGDLSFLDTIPLVTFYVARTGFMTAKPPLEDLAWINLAHWQSGSDQRNILRFARCATMFGAGIKPKELVGRQPIGANMAIFAEDPNATLQYAEHSGKAIEAGQKDLDALEDQMTALSLEPLLRRSGNPTATAVAIDTASSDSPLVASVRREEQALEAGFQFAAKWKQLVDAKASVDIAEDFELSLRDSKEIENLLALRKGPNPDISRRTLWDALKRRSVLPATFDADEESQRMAAERAAEPPPPVPPALPTPPQPTPPAEG